jgi:hypothetical protein
VEYRRAPKRNEDAGYVYTELLGYDAEHIERLRNEELALAAEGGLSE